MELGKCKKCKESFASSVDSDICSFCRPQDKATEWISVDDRLPENGDFIICSDRNGAVEPAYYNGEKFILGNAIILYIKHWRYYPAPPSK